jgi:hypothetical protein
MKDFIFITFEGYTFQPNSESDIPDIENMQVIGFSKGLNSKEAFENLKIKSSYLKETNLFICSYISFINGASIFCKV